MTRLGIITIGQAPRPDLTPEIAALLPGTRLIERGVLDGLTAADIRQGAPRGGDHALTTRLADGSSVVIGESFVAARLPGLVAELEREADAVLLACTGSFPEPRHTKPLFVPDRMIALGTAALAGDTGCVGVVCPLSEQQADTTAKFARRLPAGARVITDVCSPYTATPADLAGAARRLAGAGADVLALDCVGYTEAMRAHAAAVSGLPVVLARSVCVRLASEVLDSLGAARAVSG
ncbi:AroM family protein [Marinitenerispora sediminis]|uniref:AroM family protein n=1 Tax=Marinitenerispora sediminis TaxID=1931232 RepID=A0A368SYP6_9ACTN|nr:AroM family protein [Marinitenerispora sediminis]RCV47636.1 AroM family protein [Marinitenerispora sediminis]RCV48012.1 AroM family protein [Marinitenerispora sediminis]RCV49454.1 AroM family protein [Marinitenerispora sediminis]